MQASRLGYNKLVETLLFHPDIQVNKIAWDDGNTALIYAVMDFKKRCDYAPCYYDTSNIEDKEYFDVVNLLLRCPDTDVFYHINNDLQTAEQIAIQKNISIITEAFKNRRYMIGTGHTCCSIHANKGLQIAVRDNELEVTTAFLKCSEIDVNKGYESGLTPLYIAARQGHFEIVQQLLKITKINVNQITNGETALIAAAERGYTDIAHLLLDIPTIVTNINKRESEGSALFLASTNGHSMIVEKLLLQPQIEVNGAYGPEQMTSLIASSTNGFLTVVKLLLRCPKTNISLENLFGNTAFNVSGHDIREAINNRSELLKGNHTCCLNANVVLLNLAKSGDYKGIRGLAKCPNHIIDINVQNLRGRTGLYLAAWMGHLDAVNEFLPLQGINVNEGGLLTGETPYSIASKKSHFDVMKTLTLHNNVNVNTGWIHDSWTAYAVSQELSSLNEVLKNSLRLNSSTFDEIGKGASIKYVRAEGEGGYQRIDQF